MDGYSFGVDLEWIAVLRSIIHSKFWSGFGDSFGVDLEWMVIVLEWIWSGCGIVLEWIWSGSQC